MQNIVAVLISGLATGSTYALIVLGMTLLVLVRRIVHFGFAYIVVMTAYLGWVVLGLTNDNVFISLPAFIIIGIILVVSHRTPFPTSGEKGRFSGKSGTGSRFSHLLDRYLLPLFQSRVYGCLPRKHGWRRNRNKIRPYIFYTGEYLCPGRRYYYSVHTVFLFIPHQAW